VSCDLSDSDIDTRTFTRPKKSNRQNAASKPNSDHNPSEGINADIRQTVGQLEQPTDESPLCNSFEINSRTFTRSLRNKKSLLAAEAEAVEYRSSSSSLGASDVDERVRCNGGESMVDSAADVYWPCDEADKDHSSFVCEDHLPDMVNIQIVAKAKLQEKGRYHLQSCYHVVNFIVTSHTWHSPLIFPTLLCTILLLIMFNRMLWRYMVITTTSF